jgi:cytosine deaminase
LDLVVRDVSLLHSDSTTDIGIEGGRISEVTKSISSHPKLELRGHGGLALPTFVEPHVHLDKVFLAERIGEAKSIQHARRILRKAKESFTISDVKRRAERAIRSAVLEGVTAIRSHVDVDGIVGLKSVKALLELRREYEKFLILQIVAFPQSGLVHEEGVEELLVRALEDGADVLGGIPEAEANSEAGRAHIDRIFKIAAEKQVDLDLHCDVIPTTRYTEYYAKKVVKHAFQRRATVDHMIALSYYSDSEAREVIRLLKTAQMNVVCCPCTMMVSGATNQPPLSRGVTRIREIVKAGINFAYGLDNVVDPYNPFGDFDPLRNGWLLAYQGQLNSAKDMLSILKMPTYNSARILRLPRYGLRPGCRADFNVLSATSPRQALRSKTVPWFVLRSGVLLARNTLNRRQIG